MSITHPHTGTETFVRNESRFLEAVVIGADTFIGFCLAKALADHGRKVTAYGGCDTSTLACASSVHACASSVHADASFVHIDASALSGAITRRATDYLHYTLPPDCSLVFFCHDVSQDRDLHIRALSALCEHLADTHTMDRQVRLCYCSSSNICNADGRRITEKSEIHPHCLRDAAVVQAEMLLKTWCGLSRNAIAPHVFRYGELYGDPDLFPMAAGHVNECLSLARQGRALSFYGNLDQMRTLTHIDDFATAVAAISLQDFAPNLVNIPGERLSVVDYLMAIAERYGVDWEPTTKRPDVIDENNPFPSCDRILSSALFKSLLPDFKPKRRFKKWLFYNA